MNLRLALGALVLLGCSRPPTQIVVRVDSDLREGEELRAVRIDATREGETTPSVHKVFDLTTGRVHLPGTLGMVPADPDDTRTLRVVVTGLLDTGVTFDFDALVRFEPEREVQLDVFLARRCASPENACAEGETCTLDGCAPVARGALPPLGTVTPRDASTPDAPRDVAPDLTPDTSPDVTPDAATDAVFDATIDVFDAATDATIDVFDAATDAPVDGARDAAVDVARDVGRDTGRDVGVDSGPTCGAIGLPCCPGGVCGALQFCGGPGVCSACGRLGMACCPDNVCGTGLNCNTARGTVCESCGHLGELCCRLNVCSEFEFCSGFGVCGSCGDYGAACCPVGPACRSGTTCMGRTCL